MIVVITTHPIQYQVPLWREMERVGIDFEVWYLTDFGTKTSFDVQFGKRFAWDIPLLDGYTWRFLKTKQDSAPNKGFSGIILKENIKEKLKAINATHVYINGWQVAAYWQALWAAKSLNLQVIFKGESNDLKPEIPWKWPIKKLLLSQFFKRIDHFLYIGEANKRLYLKHSVKMRKLLPGLYCVDNERFYREALSYKDQQSEIRKAWGIADNAFCILFSGKFISKKRPLDIINAVKQLSNRGHIHIVYVGDGELYQEIKDNAQIVYDKEHGLVNENINFEIKVSIIGFLNQTEIPKAYAIADCLILPSDYGETWGLVVNEAMATGLPVIVSDQCGSAEDLVLPIYPQLVYEMGNIKELALAIAWLISNPINKEIILKRVSHYNYASTVNSISRILE